ncbi:hypothetical protein ASD23_12375 [Agromyces sp. Root1464]|uniref:hypothetical protein n=1 Tax=Agromyces sp. Root1464 TaxID=1736467 RepID=UPI0006FAA748|nr:hypothetical protein [Agromyces sp. Root1464]KQZ09092.1 hypothetical protein ASD23_12375 [Agromyces sp. Root1464]
MVTPILEASVDRAKVDTVGRWNSGIILVSIVAGCLITAGLVFAVTSGMGWFTVTVAALGAGACLISTVMALRRRRALMLLVTDVDVALTITDAGVRLAGAPFIPWHEMVFVGILDDRARSARMQRLPLSGPLATAALKAGNGTLLCEIAVRDGAALKRAFGGDPGADRVTLFDEFDGVRRGLIPLMLDAVIEDSAAHRSAKVLVDEATRRGVPTGAFTSVFGYFDWKGPMIDRKWPVSNEEGTHGTA